MSALSPCPDCARHVRVDERACPFCGAGVALEPPPLRVPSRRLGRAALFAFRAAVIGAGGVATAACGASTGLEDPIGRQDAATPSPSPSPGRDASAPPDAGGQVDAGTDGGVIALYGGPRPVPDAGADAGGGMALYGAPPPPPVERDAGAEQDAGSPVTPAYGGPSLPG